MTTIEVLAQSRPNWPNQGIACLMPRSTKKFVVNIGSLHRSVVVCLIEESSSDRITSMGLPCPVPFIIEKRATFHRTSTKANFSSSCLLGETWTASGTGICTVGVLWRVFFWHGNMRNLCLIARYCSIDCHFFPD